MFSCGPFFLYRRANGSAVLNGEQVARDIIIPFRRLLDHGVRVVMELDGHNRHPMTALQIVINRKDINGKVWGSQQAINRLEALYPYTRWAAEFVLREDRLGSIEPRKYADFVVLDRDYLTVPEDQIGQIDPVLTVVGGKFVYTDPAFASSQGLPQMGYRGSRTAWPRGTPADREQSGGGGAE